MEKKQLYSQNSVFSPIVDDETAISKMAGDIKWQEPGLTDYCIIMMYGQSLSIGTPTPACFKFEPAENLFTPQYGVWTEQDPTVTSLVPIGSNMRELSDIAYSSREQPLISAANSFVNLYHREFPNDRKTKFIVVSLGKGGKTLPKLSTEERYPWVDEHFFDTRVKPCLSSLKDIADNEGKTISLFSMFWLQGESDYSGSSINMTYEEWLSQHLSAFKSSIDGYYHGLKYLKEDLQDYVEVLFGQENKFLMVTYMTGGKWIGNIKNSIGTAQLMLADDDEDVIMAAPDYQVPELRDGHLSMNGYRWYGEYLAKALFCAAIKKQDWQPLKPIGFEVAGNIITITFNKQRLQFDTYLTKLVPDYGFYVRQGTASNLDTPVADYNDDPYNVNIISVVANGNKVVITCASELNAACVDITYATMRYDDKNLCGSGNLRDSDRWLAYNTYGDDKGDHGNMHSGWTFVFEDEKSSAVDYVDGTAYNLGDIVRMPGMAADGYSYYKSTKNNNTTYPRDEVDYRPTDSSGNPIVDKAYPMQNWCVNFYKRILN